MQDNNLQNLWEPVFRGNVQSSFDRLTEADVDRIGGDAAVFLQLLQERYGYTPEEAEAAMDTFMKRYGSFDNTHAGDVASGEDSADSVPQNTDAAP